jgi:hypothetical protein
MRVAGKRWSGRTGALGARDRGATLGDGTGDTFLGLWPWSVCVDEREPCVTYTTLAKAGTEAIAASETREGEATIVGERARSEVRPAETLVLVVITLVGRSTRAGVEFVGAPVLNVFESGIYINSVRVGVESYRSGSLARSQKREKRNSRSDLHSGRRSATSDGEVGRQGKIEWKEKQKMEEVWMKETRME